MQSEHSGDLLYLITAEDLLSIGGQREGAEHLMVFMGGKNNISRPAVGS